MDLRRNLFRFSLQNQTFDFNLSVRFLCELFFFFSSTYDWMRWVEISFHEHKY